MRGRVLTGVLLLLAASSAFPQCSYTTASSWDFRNSYLDVAVGTNDIWAATGYGVQRFDTAGRLLQTIAVPGPTRVVAPAGSVGAYAGSGSSVYFLEGAAGATRIGGSVDTGGTVNDLVFTANGFLYAATNNGLQQFDLLNPRQPLRTNATFATSTPNVSSLALSGSTLYAADGDNTVEIFDITIPNVPQKIGQLTSLPRSLAVHVTASPRVYVSDGLSTDVFIGSGPTATKVATLPYGTTAFAPLTGDIVAAAGSDRRFHALDWTNAGAPVEIFAADILPNGGTINRAAAMAVNGNSLFIGAGDAGLQRYDLTGFTAPFAVRSYATGGTTSVRWEGGKLYASRAGGGISEFTKSASGTLTPARQWDARVHTLYDSNNGFLLSSTGKLLTLWTLTSTTPVLASSASFQSNIVSAALIGFTAYVVLDDNSLWTADLTQTTATPVDAHSTATSVARSGNALAFAQVRDDGTTSITYSVPGTAAPVQTISVPGSATTPVALSGTTAVVFTYRGINVISFATGTVTVLTGSSGDVAEALAFHGAQILEIVDSVLRVWDPATGTNIRTFALPAGGTALASDDLEGIATAIGVTAVNVDSTTPQPQLLSTSARNSYYKKIAAATDRLYLFDGRRIDIFSTSSGTSPRYISSIAPPGIVDFAVAPAALFTVSNSNVVNAWSRDGAPIAQTTLNEGSDVQPLAIATAGGAPWISISKGCLSGACVKETLVLDPHSLVRTTLLDGAAVDVTSNGTRAWAIFDLPASVRAYNDSDPINPSIAVQVNADGSTTPVSIAESNGTIYVLGEKLYAYDENTLAKTSEQLSSYQPDLGGAFTYVDQRIRIDGTCGFISGRSASPQLYTVPQWSAPAAAAVPASVRSVASAGGRLYLLTDNSVEVWATQPPTPPSRQHAVR